MSVHPPHILIAEDLEENRFALERMLRKSDFEGMYTITKTGDEAWEFLQKNPDKYSVGLFDRMMPGLSGMGLLNKMKEDSRFSRIPIIFQTAMAQTDDVTEGLAAGAFYYVTKPYPEKSVFLSIIQSAVNQYQTDAAIQAEIDDTTVALHMMDRFELHFQSMEESRLATTLISKACPDPLKVGMGLSELLLNAVEHGNAGISYDEKGEINTAGTLVAEVARRLALPENSNKKVTVHFERKRDAIHIIIQDEGLGFEWQKYLQMDPDRAFDNHGRGIAMAGIMSFDQIEYRGTGSEVLAVINL